MEASGRTQRTIVSAEREENGRRTADGRWQGKARHCRLAGAMSYGGRGALYGVCIMEDLTAVYVAGASGTPTKGGIERERERERQRNEEILSNFLFEKIVQILGAKALSGLIASRRGKQAERLPRTRRNRVA